MRLGAPIYGAYENAEQWVELVKGKGYRAANSPLTGEESDAEMDRYAFAARAADIVIAEQGAWRCNCISTDDAQRKSAVNYCARQLAAADRVGARCCVSLCGSRGDRWAAPHADNFREDVFGMIVDNAREIIDMVKPKNSFYTLEAMPWAYPYDVDSYERLIKAIDRDAFGVHYDPVNLVYSPDRYYHNGKYMSEFVRRLGGEIRACHVKDVKLLDQYVFHLEERIPGQGDMDYKTLLKSLAVLDPDIPIMMEHLTKPEQYDQGETFLRTVAGEIGLSL
ncbi:MAG: sugar phosphate isomerase/epimerase family protein [Acetanaerobacterium sp.]